MELGGHQSKDFTDRELEDAMAEGKMSGSTSPDPEFLAQEHPPRASEDTQHKAHARRRSSRPRWMRASSPEHDADEADDDVPPSLLVEGHRDDDDQKTHLLPPPPPPRHRSDSESPVPGPSSHGGRVHWEGTQTQQPHHSAQRPAPAKRWSLGQHPSLATVDPKEKAMWRWANVENLDNFVRDVYTYFLGNGIWSILLTRALNLLYVCRISPRYLSEIADGSAIEPSHSSWASRRSLQTV